MEKKRKNQVRKRYWTVRRKSEAVI